MKAGGQIRSTFTIRHRLESSLPAFKDCVTTFSFSVANETYELFRVVLGEGNKKRALISGGIHGDEPAGVETILRFLETGEYVKYTEQWEITLIPCINPSGWERNTRENAEGVDLNRKFKETAPTPEVEWMQSITRSPFQLDLELHEDVDSPGYYLYQKEAHPEIDLGRKIIGEVSKIMPINNAEEIEEMPADNGVLGRLSDPDSMEWWPMALYVAAQGCPRVYTLETGTDFPMETRVRAHLKAIEVGLKNC